MKKKVTLLMDEKVVKRAKAEGINISQFCETALKRAIKALEGSSGKSNCGGDNPHSTNVLKDGGIKTNEITNSSPAAYLSVSRLLCSDVTETALSAAEERGQTAGS